MKKSNAKKTTAKKSSAKQQSTTGNAKTANKAVKAATKISKKAAKKTIANRATAPERNTGYRNPPVPRRRANIIVTHENALQLSACFACIRNIAEDIAKLPWNVFARANGKRIKLDGSQLNRLLNTRPNPEQGAFEFRRTLVSWALSWGNGYAEIDRDGSMRPSALWLISPDRADPVRINGEVWLRVQNFGQEETYLAPEDYLHLKGPSFDGIKGYSMIGIAAQAIGFSLAAEEHGANFYGNDTTLGTLFKMGTALSDEAYKRLKDDIDERKGSKRAWEGLILEEGMDIANPSTKQVDAQYLETRRYEVEEVCRFWRVPPHKVGELTNAHFRNVEQLNIAYATDCLQPWIKVLEEEADYKLISPRAGDNRYTRIALQGLMRGDSKARVEYYKGMHGIGAFSINKILELEDEDPIGPEGDEHFMQSAMTTVKNIVEGKTLASSNPALPAPGGDEEGDPENDDDNGGEQQEDAAAVLAPSIRALAQRFMQRDIAKAERARAKYNYDDAGFSRWLQSHHDKECALRNKALDDLLESAVLAYGNHIDPEQILITYELCANQELENFYRGKIPDVEFVTSEFLRAFTHGTKD